MQPRLCGADGRHYHQKPRLKPGLAEEIWHVQSAKTFAWIEGTGIQSEGMMER